MPFFFQVRRGRKTFCQPTEISVGKFAFDWETSPGGELENEEPVWETDEEFYVRIAQERDALRREQTQRISSAQNEVDSQEEEQTAEIRDQLGDALSTLRRSTWMLKGSDVELEIGEYDRNARQWPFTMSSTKEWVLPVGYPIVKDFANETDPRNAAMELNNAVQAGVNRSGFAGYIKV